MIILGLLDVVSANDGMISMIVVLLPGDEVGLSQKLLLVMFEFSNHVCDDSLVKLRMGFVK